MAASLGSDSPPATARSSSPPPHHIPTDETIQNVIERATANARAANGGRSPVIGRDTRTQLFVGNLPYRVRWQDLKDLFRKAGGTVLRADVCLGPDNRSRGYGTVLLASAEDAGRAIDMFNGYVWQTRTLEVRPDRLPNDFDSSAGVVGASMNKLALGLSPQPTHYATTSHTMTAAAASAVPSAIHPLSMSPGPGGTLSSLQASSAASASVIGHSTLGMTTGLPSVFSQDSSSTSNTTNFTTADALRTSIAGDMTRSPSAIKLPPTSSTPSNAFDSIAATAAAVSSNGIIPSSLSHPPTLPFGSSDPARRTVYVANWPPQYGKSDLDHFFRSAGTVVKSDLSASNGSDNTSYGTVVYSTEEEAKNAVAQLNGFELNGRSLNLHIGKAEQLPLSLAERRKSDEIASTTSTNMTNAPTTATTMIPNGHHHVPPEASYSYASYVPMSHPAMPAGYILASPPGSPYEQYPPPVGYMQVSTSPTTAYPPPLNGGMYAYSAWQHAPHKPPSPPSVAPLNGSASGTVSGLGGNSTSNGGSGNTGPSSSSATAGTSTNSRVPPGPISLPSPSISGYPPAPISPMHLPPITPSMPSFTFVNHPMPTPPLHHPHHHHPQFMSAAGMGTYSPLGSPGFYRTVNPYFNLSPGAPVPYHHDANAIASNGVIGSGVAGMLQSGQVTTPYFDRTAATAGSDAPQEYFPPMPITTSLTGAMHAMHISSSNANASANANGSGSNSENESKNEDQPFLEPVGVGRDGFPSLSAKPTEHKATDGVSRTGLTDWVTTPDDLPGSGNKEQSPGSSNDQSTPSKKSALESPATMPAERASSVGPMGAKALAPASGNSNKKIPTTAGSPSPGSGRRRPFSPSSSSNKKPKLNLGPIPGFSPPARMVSGYAAAVPPSSTSSSSMMGTNGTVVANRAAQDQYRNGSNSIVLGGHHHHGSGGQASRGHGTPNGREVLAVVDHEAAGHRRNSWAEDNTRRQSISHELQVGNVEGGYVR